MRDSIIHPSVSVIIPVKNRKTLLQETVQSVLAQTYDNWECIIVDDGSTDGTFETANEFSQVNSRIRAVKRIEFNQTPGAPACRNVGSQNALGEWVLFLDSDDLLSPDCLATRIASVHQSDVDFSVYRCVLFKKTPGDVIGDWNLYSAEEPLLRFLQLDIPWQTSSVLWRRESLRDHSWREDLPSGQDWDFHARAIICGLRHETHDDGTCFWRLPGHQTIGSTSSTSGHARSKAKALLDTWSLTKNTGFRSKKHRLAFAGLMLRYLIQLFEEGDFRSAHRMIWASLRCGIFSKFTTAALAICATYHFPFGSHRMRKLLKRVLPPKLFPVYPKHFRLAKEAHQSTSESNSHSLTFRSTAGSP